MHNGMLSLSKHCRRDGRTVHSNTLPKRRRPPASHEGYGGGPIGRAALEYGVAAQELPGDGAPLDLRRAVGDAQRARDAEAFLQHEFT
jgi:hypothetical protein